MRRTKTSVTTVALTAAAMTGALAGTAHADMVSTAGAGFAPVSVDTSHNDYYAFGLNLDGHRADGNAANYQFNLGATVDANSGSTNISIFGQSTAGSGKNSARIVSAAPNSSTDRSALIGSTTAPTTATPFSYDPTYTDGSRIDGNQLFYIAGDDSQLQVDGSTTLPYDGSTQVTTATSETVRTLDFYIMLEANPGTATQVDGYLKGFISEVIDLTNGGTSYQYTLKDYGEINDTVTAAAGGSDVPEPAALALLALGGLGIAGLRRRNRDASLRLAA